MLILPVTGRSRRRNIQSSGPASRSTARLWAGLEGPADWARDSLLLDKARLMREWTGHLPDQYGGGNEYIVVDENGYPTHMPAELVAIGNFFLTDQADEDASILNGRYRVTFDGAGTLQFFGASNVTSHTGYYEFDYTVAADSIGFNILTTTEGNHLRNIKCFKIEHAALIASGRITNPDYYWNKSKLALARLMDQQLSNIAHPGEWANRSKPTYYSDTMEGMCVEHLVKIGNELEVDIWVNFPFQADDNYITNFCTYIRDNLNPSLKCYFEWANEVWNFAFQPVIQYCISQANSLGFTPGGNSWLQYAGMRSAQCMDIAADVFDGQTSRIVRVIGTQTGYLGLEDGLLHAPQSVALGNAQPYLSFDAYAVTGYFGGSFGAGDKMNALLDELEANGSAAAQAWLHQDLIDGSSSGDDDGSLAQLFEQYDYHRNICDTHGLKLVMYEGGTHLVGALGNENNEDLSNLFLEFNYSDYMADLYERLFSRWDQISDGGFNQFVATARATKFGSWGAKRHLTDTNPRLTALLEYNTLKWFGAPRTESKRHITGHSLSDNPMPDDVHSIALDRGFVTDWQQQNILGSPLRGRTRGGAEEEPGWAGYSMGKNRGLDGEGQPNTGLNCINELLAPATIVGPYTDLIALENHALSDNLIYNNSHRYLMHYIKRAMAGNSTIRPYLYHVWWDVYDKSNPTPWLAYERAAEPVWRALATRMNLTLELEGSDVRVLNMPISTALCELVERATTGTVPGITLGSVTLTMNSLFNDDVHLKQLGVYYVACVVFAITYGVRPSTKYLPDSGVTAEQARSLQQIAWEFVLAYDPVDQPMATVGAYMEGAFRTANNSYRTSNQYSATGFFLSSAVENPFYFNEATDAGIWYPAP